MTPSEPGAATIATRLPSALTAPHSARRFLTRTLTGWNVARDVIDVVTLLASELVTNAVRHGHGAITVTVAPPPPVLRVEVHDDDHTAVALPARRADGGAEGGRGLDIVETLSSRWGVHQHPGDGKDVWFELDDAR